MEFRELKADEIDVRVQSIRKEKSGSVYAIFLLYKDARCDMNILDETVGIENWKRSHEVVNGNLFCNVSIFNKDIGEWVTKQDVGTESNTEKEKGQASDSFKRACVNWGIGRELYTSPFIIVYLDKDEFSDSKGKLTTNLKLTVKDIEYAERKISKLVLADGYSDERYTYPKSNESRKSKKQPFNESASSVVLDNPDTKKAYIHEYCNKSENLRKVISDLYPGKKLSELSETDLDGIIEVIKTVIISD